LQKTCEGGHCRSALCRLTFIEGAAGAFHFFQDVGGSRGPDERFWTFVVTVDVGADGHDEFFQVVENAPPKPILGRVAKETFHHVEPRRAGGSEVQMKARVPGQPALYFGMLMGGVVIANQVELPVRRDGLIDQTEKFEPFLVAMLLLAQAKDFAVGRIQRGKQSGGAVAFVIMRHGRAAPALQRQTRLGTVQSLDLALLVGAQHQRVFGRIEVQADDVFQFLRELGIVT